MHRSSIIRLGLLAALALNLDPTVSQIARGQEAGSEKPAETAETEAEAPLTVEDAIGRTIELLDQLDARIGEGPTQKELEELNNYIVAIQSQEPDDPRVNYLYGRAWALMGSSRLAISALEEFVETREGRLEWKAFRTLGDLFIDGFPQLAKRNYERALVINPSEPSVIYGLSRANFQLGDQEKALELARRAVRTDPHGRVAYVSHLAKMHMANQQWADADRTALSGLEMARKSVEELPGRRGPLVVLQGQLDTMIGVLRTRSQASGASSDSFTRLAQHTVERAEVAAQLAKYDALSILEGAKKRFQSDASLLEQYAVLLAEIGRTDDAIEVFHELQEVDEDNATAKEWLQRLDASPKSADAENR